MPDFHGVHKILVIKLRHIGDVLLTVPVFRALRERFPQAHIAALVNSGTEQVLAGNPLLDEIIIYDRTMKKLPLHRRYMKELAFLRSIRSRGFDLTVDLTSGDRAALLSFVSGAKTRFAYDPRGAGIPGKKHLYTHLAANDEDRHMVLQNLGVIGQFGISTDNLDVDIVVPEQDQHYVQEVFRSQGRPLSGRIVHIHPVARWLFKCWKDEYMAEVIHRLVARNVTVIVTSSPFGRELRRAKDILVLVGEHPRVVDLCGKTSIKQLAALSEAADLFIGVDTAPMHIAAAVGTPVVALFGPTGEVQWHPWGGDHIVLTRKMRCWICAQGMCDGVVVRKCLEAITPDEVIQAADSVFARQAAGGQS
jgi:heptosyltransferase-3